MMNPVLSLDHVSFSFGPLRVLEDVSLQLQPGSLTALTGPNGAGKSTLLKLMAGLLKPTKGRIKAPTSLAYLPQISTLPRDFPLQVRQVVVSGLWPQLGEWGAVTPALVAQAEAALATVGLAGFGARRLDELSGGQFQRMLLARVLLQNASVVLLDEPFAAIDTAGQTSLMAMLQEWQRKGTTIVCVTHDPQLVRRAFPQVLVCEGGQIWQGATPDTPPVWQERMFA